MIKPKKLIKISVAFLSVISLAVQQFYQKNKDEATAVQKASLNTSSEVFKILKTVASNGIYFEKLTEILDSEEPSKDELIKTIEFFNMVDSFSIQINSISDKIIKDNNILSNEIPSHGGSSGIKQIFGDEFANTYEQLLSLVKAKANKNNRVNDQLYWRTIYHGVNVVLPKYANEVVRYKEVYDVVSKRASNQPLPASSILLWLSVLLTLILSFFND